MNLQLRREEERGKQTRRMMRNEPDKKKTSEGNSHGAKKKKHTFDSSGIGANTNCGPDSDEPSYPLTKQQAKKSSSTSSEPPVQCHIMTLKQQEQSPILDIPQPEYDWYNSDSSESK